MQRLPYVVGLNAILLGFGGCASEPRQSYEYYESQLPSVTGVVTGIHESRIFYNSQSAPATHQEYRLTNLFIMSTDGHLHSFLYLLPDKPREGQTIRLHYQPLPSGRIEAKALIDCLSEQQCTTEDTQTVSAEGIIARSRLMWLTHQNQNSFKDSALSKGQ